MAQKVSVILIDDVDGSEADETIGFALDGISYEIDLSSDHAEQLREALEPWVSHGRRTGGSKRRPAAVTKPSSTRSSSNGNGQLQPEDRQHVRAWANESGFSVADRGRIAAEVITAWQEAGSPRG